MQLCIIRIVPHSYGTNGNEQKQASGKRNWKVKVRTSSFLIAASAFAFCRFSHAVILASSLWILKHGSNLGELA